MVEIDNKEYNLLTTPCVCSLEIRGFDKAYTIKYLTEELKRWSQFDYFFECDILVSAPTEIEHMTSKRICTTKKDELFNLIKQSFAEKYKGKPLHDIMIHIYSKDK